MTRDEGFNVITMKKGFSGKRIFEQRPEGSKIGSGAKENYVKSVFR